MTKGYPSNLTWSQWELIADLFRSAKPGGRPRTIAMYTVVNAILYVLCQGCTWRALPGDFPAWSTERWLFPDVAQRWHMVKGSRVFSTSGFVSRQGVTQALLKLRSDSQSVETATMISIDVGYDAGKQVHGRKRQLK